MLKPQATCEATVQAFHWKIPEHYNIGIDACDKWADGSGRLALIIEKSPAEQQRYTFDDLRLLSNRFARAGLMWTPADRAWIGGLFDVSSCPPSSMPPPPAI